VKRRELLSIATVGGISGCFSSDPDSTVLGFEQPVETVVCGDVVGTPCNKELPSENWSVQEDLVGGIKAYYADGHVVVAGYITADSHSSHPDARVSEVRVHDSTIFISVRNVYNPIKIGSHPGVESMLYRVRISNVSKYTNVKVKYYSESNKKKLSEKIRIK
jgi:hypothetical protein